MINKISPLQTRMFDSYEVECELKMNDFMKTVDVVDVKMNTVVAVTGNFFTRYLVLYREFC